MSFPSLSQPTFLLCLLLILTCFRPSLSFPFPTPLDIYRSSFSLSAYAPVCLGWSSRHKRAAILRNELGGDLLSTGGGQWGGQGWDPTIDGATDARSPRREAGGGWNMKGWVGLLLLLCGNKEGWLKGFLACKLQRKYSLLAWIEMDESNAVEVTRVTPFYVLCITNVKEYFYGLRFHLRILTILSHKPCNVL